MATRQEILNAAFDALYATRAVRNKTDFAQKIGYNNSVMSSAFNGLERYLTDNLFYTITKVFPQINPAFMETGEGDILREIPLEEAAKQAACTPAQGEQFARMLSVIDKSQANVERMIAAVEKQQEQMAELIDIIKNHLV